jgi:hypothetical protein
LDLLKEKNLRQLVDLINSPIALLQTLHSEELVPVLPLHLENLSKGTFAKLLNNSEVRTSPRRHPGITDRRVSSPEF